jgi:septum formation protein
MLMRLQGREHRVLTGVAVVAPAVVGGDAADGERSWGWDRVASLEGDRRSASGVEAVRVWFRAFDEATALEYIATGEPMDKAGAYGIQGYGATIVERVDGDYFAVMGLALGRMIGLFRELGWRYNFRGLEPL